MTFDSSDMAMRADRLDAYRDVVRREIEWNCEYVVMQPGTAEQAAIAMYALLCAGGCYEDIAEARFRMLRQRVIFNTDTPMPQLQRAAVLAVWRAQRR